MCTVCLNLPKVGSFHTIEPQIIFLSASAIDHLTECMTSNTSYHLDVFWLFVYLYFGQFFKHRQSVYIIEFIIRTSKEIKKIWYHVVKCTETPIKNTASGGEKERTEES